MSGTSVKVSVLVSFLIGVKEPLTEATEDGEDLFWLTVWEDTVHHGREVTAVVACFCDSRNRKQDRNWLMISLNYVSPLLLENILKKKT